jgi:hypothetical protein
LTTPMTLLANWLCRQGQFEAGEMAGPGPVQRAAVPPGVQADQVERDRGEHVFQVGLGQAAIAGAAQAAHGDALPDGAFHPARIAYRACQSVAAWAVRAARWAWCTWRGGTVNWRPNLDEAERVHWSRAGQARQVAAANLTTITSRPRWTAGNHQELVLPCGQTACAASKSMAKLARS